MSTFEYLLIGHLVADWLLQSDWMAIGKSKQLLSAAGLVHYSIYTLAILLMLCWSQPPLCSLPIFGSFSSAIFVSHWLIDGTCLVQWWMQQMGQRDQLMVRIMVDQTLHLLVLALLITFLPAG